MSASYDQEISLAFSGDDIVLSVCGKVYENMSSLKDVFSNMPPEIFQDPDVLEKIAIVYQNNTRQGENYAVITDVDKYVRKTQDRIKREILEGKKAFDPVYPRIIDFGIPVYELIELPQIIDGKIVYYAAEKLYRIPYRITGDLFDPSSAKFEVSTVIPYEFSNEIPDPDKEERFSRD